MDRCFGKKDNLFLVCSTSQLASHIGLYMLTAYVVFRQVMKGSSVKHDREENMAMWRSTQAKLHHLWW